MACEFSGTVREAFRRRGHDAWSCDLLPADDHSIFHLHGDVRDWLDEEWDTPWDLMIAHPPCTYLASSGLHWNKRVAGRAQQTEDALLATCLWLKNLPPLQPRNPLPGDNKTRRANQTPSGQNKLGPSPDRWKLRSITYPGFATAMAEQWGRL